LAIARAASAPDDPDPADLTVGARDSRVVDLRERWIGPEVEATVECPACASSLELTFPLQRLRSPSPAGVEAATRGDATTVTARLGAYSMTARVPTSRDVSGLHASGDLAAARTLLLERCLVRATRGSRHIEARSLPEPAVLALGEALAAADPLADAELAITCADCGCSWSARLDLVSFVWTEIEQLAAAMTREVHVLAQSYGWSEAEILALAPGRRRRYLELVSDG
jgi:hypothetical protein